MLRDYYQASRADAEPGRLDDMIENYGHISNWDVTNIKDMSNLFTIVPTDFDEPIGGWDVSRVTNMEGMFFELTSFNQPLNNWDVSNVTNMALMFTEATSFNHHKLGM